MKKIVVIAVAILLAHTAFACDVCGGGAGSQYIGLLPGLNRNFAGIQFLSGNFTSRFPSAYQLSPKPDDVTEDRYNTLQIWGRHKIGKNYQIFVFIPYQYNTRLKNNESNAVSGMGDMSLLLNRTIINTQKGAWQHTVFGGVGIKLPTGSNKSIQKNALSSFDGMKPGTGTWDFLLNANYTFQNSKFGINLDPSVTLTTASSVGYKVGNRYSIGAIAFYKKALGDFLITPQMGVRFEYATLDFYNYKQNWSNLYSGGEILYTSAGLQVAYRSVGLRFIGNLPVTQHYAEGRISARVKLETGFFVTF